MVQPPPASGVSSVRRVCQNQDQRTLPLEEQNDVQCGTLVSLLCTLNTTSVPLGRRGGGIYQRDSFYDLADEYGIMVWEDMMWACAQYAVPDSYLRSAAKEVQDNVRRMQRHPSIVLWAGNNENEKDLNAASLKEEAPYSALYFATVLANISSLDQSRPMTASSPSNGNETADHPFSINHQSEFYGDVHSYLYGADSWDPSVFKRPRFMSEFGLQSWPSAITLKDTFPPDQWSFSSNLSTNRNHHPDGQDEILQQISMHYHLPKLANNTPGKRGMYKAWRLMLYLTQVNQAYGYKTEVEQLRRIRTECSETVPGCNMGQMFWQTNDIWPGASWAAIDYTGRYKMVQYAANRFYAPVLVSAFVLHDVTFHAYVINDLVHAGVAGHVEFTMHSWQHGPLGSWSVTAAVPPASAREVYNCTFSELLARGNCPDPTMCVLTYKLYDDADAVVSTNMLFLANMFDVNTMKDPALTAGNVTKVGKNSEGYTVFDVTVSTAATAPFVWLEVPEQGHWSDNGFLMTEAEPTRILQFHTLNATLTADELGRSLCCSEGAVWSLYDTDRQDYGSGVSPRAT